MNEDFYIDHNFMNIYSAVEFLIKIKEQTMPLLQNIEERRKNEMFDSDVCVLCNCHRDKHEIEDIDLF